MGRPGSFNCCIVGCNNYYEKTKNNKDDQVSYIGFPRAGINPEQDEWRRRMIVCVRRADKSFNPDNAKVCSVHFQRIHLVFHGKGYKPVKGTLPTLNMPSRSVEIKQPPQRKLPCPREPPAIPKRVAYSSFKEVETDVARTESWVLLRSTADTITFGQVNENADIEIKVTVTDAFVTTVTRLGLLVPLRYDLETGGLRGLVKKLQEYHWCTGSSPRSKQCAVIDDTSSGICRFCEETIKAKSILRPISLNTPLSLAPVPSLVQELKSTRCKLKEKESQLLYIRRKMEKESILIADDVKRGLEQIIESADIEDDFLKLFWSEQKKAAGRDPRGMRWHPMMIRFAIFLHYQSPRAYECLRNTGVLHLPNKSTLRDYTNFFQAKEGFQTHVCLELRQFASKLPDNNRYVAIMHDEMAIRGDLVYDHRCGEIIGFINPETWNFKKDEGLVLATHVIVFMAVGINNNLKVSLGQFATHCATADVLFPLLWEAISLLEQQGFKVISCTSDKASPNQRLYRMHGDEKIVWETINPYAENDRPLFFISDPPHLIKTIRNNLEHSRPGGTRCLWNNDQHLWWQYISRVYEEDWSRPLRMTKLRDEHIHLTPSSRMSVRLAAQVLSNTVGVVLRDHHDQDVQQLSKFVTLCDRFFDCLNVRSFTEHITKRKPDLAPYQRLDDHRFDFLEEFLLYLETWKNNVGNRNGFSKAEKEKMFLTYQTYEGIVTTVRGFVGATKYLLSHGLTYVFSNTFCQDPIEEHFGRHRGLGVRSRNPSVYEFGHQENQLRIQRTLAFQFTPRGNTAGQAQGQQQIVVDGQPLPKIQRRI